MFVWVVYHYDTANDRTLGTAGIYDNLLAAIEAIQELKKEFPDRVYRYSRWELNKKA